MGDADPAVTCTVEGGVARVHLNRPSKRNAFDEHTAAALGTVFEQLDARSDVRAVVLGGEGPVFCAGGDLDWMRRVSEYDEAANLADAAAFQRAFDGIEDCRHPVVGRIQGAALGGGAGLVAVCDVAVAAEDARIGFPEVRLGLVPGVISPYVVRKIGDSRARHLFLTGEVFDGREALRIGLVHRAVRAEALDDAVEAVLDDLGAAPPGALRRAKSLLRDVSEAKDRDAAADAARRAIAAARASAEGREGTQAFLEKRKPEWRS
ncbi:MAG: enoyl-CoA hydratase-related protein [Planctomycetota bacterium]|jgi:methylglutaconyl-CoA hydratase